MSASITSIRSFSDALQHLSPFRKAGRARPRGIARLGMTLIEIMIVVTIMASIMAVAGYYIFGMGNQSKIKLADSKTKELVKLIKTYVQSGNKAPANLEEMRKNGFIDEVPADPWGNEYQISIQGKNINVSSFGPDGSGGNEDDIKAEGTTN